jgi:protein SCO1/2
VSKSRKEAAKRVFDSDKWFDNVSCAAVTDANDFMRRRIKRRSCLSLLLASFVVLHDLPSRAHSIAPAPIAGFELPVPKALAAFALLDQHGRAFDNARLAGRWTFLVFGYTHCTDVCPTTLQQLREVRRTLSARHPDVPTATVFTTVDPRRDTRERLAAYADHYGDSLTAVRGEPAAIKSFADQFRVRYQARAGRAAAPAYEVDHTSTVALLGPDGRLYAVFTLPIRPEQVAADVARIHAKHAADRCVSEASRTHDPGCKTRST